VSASRLSTFRMRRRTLFVVVGSLVALSVVAWSMNSTYSARHYGNHKYSVHPYIHNAHPTPAQQSATLDVTNQFRRAVVTASQRFAVATVALVAAIRAGDVSQARLEEEKSQAAFDQMRPSFAIGVTSLAPIDAEVSDQSGQSAPMGLHAIERTLWSGRVHDALRAAEAVAQSGPLLEFGVFRTILTPSAVCGRVIEMLSWTVDSVISSSQERYSHLDMLDVRTSVLLSDHLVQSIVALGQLVQPQLARELLARSAAMKRAVAPFTNSTLDSAVSNAQWRQLSQRIAAVQASLGKMDGALNGLGTGRPYA
jgi:iron uptake system EfeUOB component EfeO/EfeM